MAEQSKWLRRKQGDVSCFCLSQYVVLHKDADHFHFLWNEWIRAPKDGDWASKAAKPVSSAHKVKQHRTELSKSPKKQKNRETSSASETTHDDKNTTSWEIVLFLSYVELQKRARLGKRRTLPMLNKCAKMMSWASKAAMVSRSPG